MYILFKFTLLNTMYKELKIGCKFLFLVSYPRCWVSLSVFAWSLSSCLPSQSYYWSHGSSHRLQHNGHISGETRKGREPLQLDFSTHTVMLEVEENEYCGWQLELYN